MARESSRGRAEPSRRPRARPTAEDAAAARAHRRKRGARAGGSIVGIRIRELETLFADRYGTALPHDDAGRDDLAVLLHHAAHYAEPLPRMRALADRWAPWLDGGALDDLIADITARPLRWRADKLAARVGLDDATRTRLRIRTIGATDITAEQRATRRREADRLAKQQQRRAAGVPACPTRSETVARQQPWLALGISRRTWYRRRRGTDGTTASAA